MFMYFNKIYTFVININVKLCAAAIILFEKREAGVALLSHQCTYLSFWISIYEDGCHKNII